ncbi:ABC transporter ATP-binding protein [Nostocoides australiense]|uniref:ABC-type multidrug transport system ATPase componen n=1 Tax=Nostocoides australiense Ben110 TaxID=1193182 RepID=W6K093_9MICO|nr:ABC transporter ATP-binding protein [Tetrasphaera australiensis]MCA0290883.1 ABC transporter ATP-binding protein [Actinomycetota bacterium]MCB1300929.1 ABC transporter ATP-binding protein [Tetrasphaera sp.]CCH74405.1 ABC-type multidrug transport system ATPase componen [Tetrasphaera australiensis Ben110]
MVPAVEVRDLVKSFGATRALDGVTWSAQSGRVTAVLGPNGAGKSTTIECLQGLQRPDSGTAHVLGEDPWGASAEHRARVGLMLQDGGLPSMSTPPTLLTHLAALYAAPADPVALAQRLGIDGFARTIIRRLSGGQRQRVALAAALIGRPDVLFLDEPTAGLDPHTRLDVWDIVREQADAGAAVVLATHSFEEADRVADDIVIMDTGRVRAFGGRAEVTGAKSLEDVYFSLTRGGKR